eukprot:1413643-Rhodomonas_salina.2
MPRRRLSRACPTPATRLNRKVRVDEIGEFVWMRRVRVDEIGELGSMRSEIWKRGSRSGRGLCLSKLCSGCLSTWTSGAWVCCDYVSCAGGTYPRTK